MRPFTVGACVLLAFAAASAAQAAPQTRFATRAVRVCAPVKGKPSAAQAAALVQCHQEHEDTRDIWLLENVMVEMGGPQPYNFKAHSHLTAIDTTSQVYPIRGGFTSYDCGVPQVIPAINSDTRGKNCSVVRKPKASGSCWKTTFGSWDCVMLDIEHNDPVLNQPPPAG